MKSFTRGDLALLSGWTLDSLRQHRRRGIDEGYGGVDPGGRLAFTMVDIFGAAIANDLGGAALRAGHREAFLLARNLTDVIGDPRQAVTSAARIAQAVRDHEAGDEVEQLLAAAVWVIEPKRVESVHYVVGTAVDFFEEMARLSDGGAVVKRTVVANATQTAILIAERARLAGLKLPSDFWGVADRPGRRPASAVRKPLEDRAPDLLAFASAAS